MPLACLRAGLRAGCTTAAALAATLSPSNCIFCGRILIGLGVWPAEWHMPGMCRSNHMGAPPPQRSAGGSAGAGEHHAEERCGSSPPCCSPRGTTVLHAAALCARRRWRNARTRRQVHPALLVVASLGERRAAQGSARCRGRRRGAKKSLFAPDARWPVSTDLSLLPGAANAASLQFKRLRSCASSSTSSRKTALLRLERVACVWRRYCVWPSSSLLHFRRR